MFYIDYINIQINAGSGVPANGGKKYIHHGDKCLIYLLPRHLSG